jgi:hypothetical protein
MVGHGTPHARRNLSRLKFRLCRAQVSAIASATCLRVVVSSVMNRMPAAMDSKCLRVIVRTCLRTRLPTLRP